MTASSSGSASVSVSGSVSVSVRSVERSGRRFRDKQLEKSMLTGRWSLRLLYRGVELQVLCDRD